MYRKDSHNNHGEKLVGGVARQKEQSMKNVKDTLGGVFTRLTTHKTVGWLILKSVIYLLIPYAYLFLCGFLFDYLLGWYGMTTFIFLSLCVLAVLALILVVVSVIKFMKKK